MAGGELTIDDLVKVQEATWDARAWYFNIGLQLGVDLGTLEAIKKTNNGICDECYTAVLTAWLRGGDTKL